MKRKYVFGAALLAACASLTSPASNPLSFSSYEREVRAVFATPEEAAAAEMKICALPHGAKLAFTTRWDDSSMKHREKRPVINAAGYKATFFLIGDAGYARVFGPGLLVGGNALGNHTTHHPSLRKETLSKMFSEIVLNRAMIESATDFPVVSFVIPYCWIFENPNRPGELVRILCDTGHYVSSDWPLPNCPVGYDTWMPGHTFDADDKAPNPEKFHARLKRDVAAALKDNYPKVTFGIHSWCDEAGNELQCKLLSEYAGNPEWFYGNDNEYGAHRYAGLHGKAVRKSVSGCEAVFSLEMFDPAQIGSDIPVSVSFSAKPTKVSVGDSVLAEDRGTYAVPHSRPRLSVADTAKNDGTFAKFPGLSVSVKPDEAAGKLSVEVVNGSPSAFDDLVVTFLPHPGWKNGRVVRSLGAVAAGKNASAVVELGDRLDDPARWSGPSLYVVSADFHMDGKACRAWASATLDNPTK